MRSAWHEGRIGVLRNPRYRLRQTVAALVAGICVGVASAGAQEPHRRILAEKFQGSLHDIAAELPGVLGVEIIDMTSGERYGVNGELVPHSALRGGDFFEGVSI